jgi:UDP-GlcNAc:undecaprenyl-phosphate/decaprenyl-phosphate GlcNAc-1-phosphate transferase
VGVAAGPDVTGAALAAGAAVGAAVAAVLAGALVRSPPRRLVRTNVRGRPVPAVLGASISAGSLAGMAVAASLGPAPSARSLWAGTLAVVGLAAAGAWDDLRGDEADRGFRGHLSAAARGRLTGGIVKVAAGGAVALLAAWLIVPSGGPWAVVESALVVALAANLGNLLDRAPGRAGKVMLVVLGLLLLAGAREWGPLGAGTLGALSGVIGADLRERGMLGDAGANPLGAVAGVGLALSLDGWWRTVCLLVLLALTAASERWSFSAVIQRTPWLATLDRLGRRP